MNARIADSPTIVARFWSYVRRGAGCWEWQASLQSGYGQIRVGRNSRTPMMRAHRLSWELHHGPVPDGLCVLHRCDNRKCVRPEHLFLGTKSDNTRDMVAKGRHHRAHLRGERHPAARVTTQQVIDARARRERGETLISIAKDLGLSISGVWAMTRGRSWKGVS
jgi:hypothetical protein